MKVERSPSNIPGLVDRLLEGLEFGCLYEENELEDPEKPHQVGHYTIDPDKGLGAVGDSNNINYMGFVTYMKPHEFLRLNPDRGEDNPHVENHMKGGGAIGPPNIRANWQGTHWRVYGHEGRARMKVMAKTPPDLDVPVQVFPRDGKEGWGLRARHIGDHMLRAPIKSDKQQPAPFTFRPHRVIHQKQEIDFG